MTANWVAGKMHVGWTDKRVIKEIRSMFDKSALTPDKRNERKKVYRAVLDAHHKNQKFVSDFRL